MRAWIAKCVRLTTAVLLWLGVLAAAAAQADQALIYRVEAPNIAPSYLLGTMHSEDPRVVGVTDQVFPLIDRVEVVAVEVVPDALTLVAVGAAMALPRGRRLRDVIGAARFEALCVAARAAGLSIEVLDRLKPWAAAMVLGLPAVHGGRILDNQIYLHALAAQREIKGLESAAEQLAVFERMPLSLQLQLLDEMVETIAQMPEQMEQLTMAYLSGDLARIDAVARAQVDAMPSDLARWFDDRLLDRRNIKMVDRAASLMRRRPTLVAVGAMHLGRDSGLIAGLRARGFRVERLRQ